MGALSVALARECFFGEEMMKRSSVVPGVWGLLHCHVRAWRVKKLFSPCVRTIMVTNLGLKRTYGPSVGLPLIMPVTNTETSPYPLMITM